MKLSCRKKIWLYVIHIISDFIEGNSQICSRRRLAKKRILNVESKGRKKLNRFTPSKDLYHNPKWKKGAECTKFKNHLLFEILMHKTIIIHVVGWLSSLFVENPFGTSAFFPFWFSHWNDVHFTVQITEFSKFSIGICFFFNRAAVGVIDEWCWIFLVLEISFGISVYKWGIYANDACHHSLRVHFYNLFRIKRHALLWCCSCSCHPHYIFNRCCSGFPYFNSFSFHREHG